MRPFGVAAASLLFGCGPSPPPHAQVEPALQVPAISSGAARPAVSVPPNLVALPDVPNVYSWEHPEVIQRLILDCRWRPTEPPRDQRNQLSCRLPSSETEYPDPCLDEYENTCKPQCSRTCEDCAKPCVASCETCKASCTSDDCKLTCAQQCAACRDVCLQGVERCQAFNCGGGYQSCQAALAEEIRKAPCKAGCQRAQQCVGKCRGGNEGCIDACLKAFPTSCSEQLFRQCTAGVRAGL